MNKAEYIARAERFAREQLDRLDEIARDLRAGGHVNEAEHAEREASRVRRRLERDLLTLSAKLDTSEARRADAMRGLLADLDRQIGGDGRSE